MHWQRAIGLVQAQPGSADAAGIDVPRVFLRAVVRLALYEVPFVVDGSRRRFPPTR